MFRTDFPSIISSLNTVFTATGTLHTSHVDCMLAYYLCWLYAGILFMLTVCWHTLYVECMLAHSLCWPYAGILFMSTVCWHTVYVDLCWHIIYVECMLAYYLYWLYAGILFMLTVCWHTGTKGAVCGHRSAHPAGESVLLKPEKCHLFLPSPMHACPRNGSRATSWDG